MSSTEKKSGSLKYRIGKVKQIPVVVKDEKTGLEYIQIQSRENERVYGVTRFLNNYKEDEKLGQGTFGEVFKGVHLSTNRKVAIKRILTRAEKDLFPITAQREITILKRMNHKNIVKLIEIVYDESPTPKTESGAAVNPIGNYNTAASNQPKPLTGKHFYMILPYMVTDLSGLLHNPRVQFDLGDVKNILLQLLEGINYIHCSKFLHRDIKTANILIDHKGVVKIADFGLARNYYGSPPNLRYPGGAGSGAKYTSVVVTRWYRAPEIVLGDRYYTTAVDIWGIGCVFAEFFEKKPILQGQTDIDQGHVIFKLMGTPSMSEWGLAYHLPGSELTKTNYKSTLKERFSSHLTETGLDLLSKLLALDPYQRLTAMSAKKHPFFSEDPLPAARIALPNEECHESDIKRYKSEMNESMSQRPPSAPTGHLSNDNSIRSVTGSVFPKELPSNPKAVRATPVPKAAVATQPSGGLPVGPAVAAVTGSRFNNTPPVRAHNHAATSTALPKGPKGAGVPTGPNTLPPNPRNSYQSQKPTDSRFNATPNARITTESYNAGKRYHNRAYDRQRDTSYGHQYGAAYPDRSRYSADAKDSRSAGPRTDSYPNRYYNQEHNPSSSAAHSTYSRYPSTGTDRREHGRRPNPIAPSEASTHSANNGSQQSSNDSHPADGKSKDVADYY